MGYANSFSQIASKLKVSTLDQLTIVSNYVNQLSDSQKKHISVWRTSQKTGLSKSVVFEILNEAHKAGILKLKFELWHPASRIKIAEFNDRSQISSPYQADDELVHFSDDDIILIYYIE